MFFYDSVDEIIEQFGKEYKSKVPVNSDYNIDQTASLGTFYTAKTLWLSYIH